jgi:hypothetical protein
VLQHVCCNAVSQICMFQRTTTALRLSCSRGMLAVEGLNLEAGQLGPVLLFSLMAHGVGYTSASKVRSSVRLWQAIYYAEQKTFWHPECAGDFNSASYISDSPLWITPILASSQEVVLAQWATKLANLRVGGGERWTGTIEAEEDVSGGKQQWRVVRRVVVPPGVMLQQVYRCGDLYQPPVPHHVVLALPSAEHSCRGG